jgi:hypothetical protein
MKPVQNSVFKPYSTTIEMKYMALLTTAGIEIAVAVPSQRMRALL